LLRSIDLGVNTISRRMDAVQAVPTQKFEGVYRRGILAELAIHLLDQPLVLPEW
jgi:hypothetical protein